MLVSSKLDIYRFTEAIGFVRDVLQLYKEHVVPSLSGFVSVLTQSYDTLIAAYQQEQSSLLTADIAEADNQRDNLYIGLCKLTDGFAYSPNLQEQKASELLARNIKHYGKDAHRLNYQAQSTVFDNLVADWQNKADLKDAVQTLGLASWVTALKTYNELVKKALIDRIQEKSVGNAESSLDLRKKMIKDYRHLAQYTDANLLLNPSDTLNTLINQQNGLINQYNLVLKKRQGSKNTGNAQEEK
jgi:Family of unknown function (DUF6261)